MRTLFVFAILFAISIALPLNDDAPQVSGELQKEQCPTGTLEENVGKNNICKFSTTHILKRLISPPSKTIPRHLQYTVWLDQAGATSPNSLIMADPEAAVVLSSGPFTPKYNWLGKRSGTNQKIDRCFGGGWAFFVDAIQKMAGKKMSSSGKDMLTRLTSRSEKDCILTFAWNDDFTRATISGYMEELIRFLPSFVSRNSLILAIQLQPYWAWKFGLPHESKEDLSAIDRKCCPPKGDNTTCQGTGKIGAVGCETISSACGTVSKVDIKTCAMWKRENFIGHLIPFGEYYGYPIGDVNGAETGFYSEFLEAMGTAGVENVFTGSKM